MPPTLEIPELFMIQQTLEIILKKLNDLETGKAQYWYDLKTACTLKGVVYDSVKSYWYDQPKGAIPEGYQHSRRVWRRDTIEEWLLIHDGNRKKYLEKYGHSVPADLSQKWEQRAGCDA